MHRYQYKKTKQTELPCSSSIFRNRSDHKQFQKIFEIIDRSQLIKDLNIPQEINKEIAEYATGKLEQCANKKCKNKIITLRQDDKMYNNDHSNAHKVGYKYSTFPVQYFCFECMNIAIFCGCDNCEDQLFFPPNCRTCHQCKGPIFQCDDGCECRRRWSCNNCHRKSCGQCNTRWNCSACGNNYLCRECIKIGAINVCLACYVPTIIECTPCNIKFQLFYKDNDDVTLKDGDKCYKMSRCEYIDRSANFNARCSIFICWNCDKKGEDKRKTVCDECHKSIGKIYCDQHLELKCLCWKCKNKRNDKLLHRKRDDQQ